MSLTERIQVLVTPEERTRLERLAKERGTSVGAVVREAVAHYGERPRRTRQEAYEALLAIEDLPVGDWSEMKAEIERRQLDDIEASLG